MRRLVSAFTEPDWNDVSGGEAGCSASGGNCAWWRVRARAATKARRAQR